MEIERPQPESENMFSGPGSQEMGGGIVKCVWADKEL